MRDNDIPNIGFHDAMKHGGVRNDGTPFGLDKQCLFAEEKSSNFKVSNVFKHHFYVCILKCTLNIN